jgi:hypothetical protein
MDTFFATKKASKSTRNHTCCQLFVTDNGFVYVVPLKSKVNVLDAVKQFAKEIGVPDALNFYMSGEQTSQPMRKFATKSEPPCVCSRKELRGRTKRNCILV